MPKRKVIAASASAAAVQRKSEPATAAAAADSGAVPSAAKKTKSNTTTSAAAAVTTTQVSINGAPAVTYDHLTADDIKKALDARYNEELDRLRRVRFQRRISQHIEKQTEVALLVTFMIQEDEKKVQWIRQTLRSIITNYNTHTGKVALRVTDPDLTFQWKTLDTQCVCTWALANRSLWMPMSPLHQNDELGLSVVSEDRFLTGCYCSRSEDNPHCVRDYCHCRRKRIAADNGDLSCTVGPCNCKHHNTPYAVYAPMVYLTLDLSSLNV